MKLLRFESHKIMFYAFGEKGLFFNLKKSCIINALKGGFQLIVQLADNFFLAEYT